MFPGNEIDSDHYLLCAKANFPPRWLNKGNKKAPLKQEESFKVRLLNDESIRCDRLQNKFTNHKGIKNNANFGKITGIQEKLDTTCKQNASQ